MTVRSNTGVGGRGTPRVPPSSGGANPALSAVVWNPGAAPGDGYVTTWDEVMTSFATTTGDFTVWLDESGGGAFSVPAATYALDRRLSLARTAPADGQLTIVMADGAIFQDLAAVRRNITLQGNSTAAAALQITDGYGIELDLGAIIENAGTYPMLEVAGNESATLNLYRDSQLQATGAEIVDLTAANATMTARFQSSSTASADWITGNVGASLTIEADASSYNAVTVASPPGSIALTRVTSYANVSWTNAYDIDFSALATQDLIAGGTFTIDGHDWLVENVGSATEFKVINGTGLSIILADFVFVQYYSANRTGPIMSCPVTSFFPDFDETIHRVKLSVGIPTCTNPFNNAYAGAKMGFEKSSAPLNFNQWWNRSLNGGVASAAYACTVNSATTADTFSLSDTARQMDWSQDVAYLRSAASYGNAWISRYRINPAQPFVPGGFGIHNFQTMRLASATDLRVFLSVDNDLLGANGFQSVFTGFKVEIR